MVSGEFHRFFEAGDAAKDNSRGGCLKSLFIHVNDSFLYNGIDKTIAAILVKA